MAPQFAPAAQTATVLVTICIIVTSILVPILTGLWYRRFGGGVAEAQRVSGPAIPAGLPAE